MKIKIDGREIELQEGVRVHCNTEEKANKLLLALHNEGVSWFMHESLLSDNKYAKYESNTYYKNEKDRLLMGSIHDYDEYNITFDELINPKVDADELYEVIKKILLTGKETLDSSEVKEIFGSLYLTDIVSTHTANQLITKYNTWKDKQDKIEIGDVYQGLTSKFIITRYNEDSEEYVCLYENLNTFYLSENAIRELCTKIGHKDNFNISFL